jgi:hypothetical protein
MVQSSESALSQHLIGFEYQVSRSSTTKKAKRPMPIRRTATAKTGVCIPSLVTPAISLNGSPQR